MFYRHRHRPFLGETAFATALAFVLWGLGLALRLVVGAVVLLAVHVVVPAVRAGVPAAARLLGRSWVALVNRYAWRTLYPGFVVSAHVPDYVPEEWTDGQS